MLPFSQSFAKGKCSLCKIRQKEAENDSKENKGNVLDDLANTRPKYLVSTVSKTAFADGMKLCDHCQKC